MFYTKTYILIKTFKTNVFTLLKIMIANLQIRDDAYAYNSISNF